ncbi:hypothetical protein WEI85_03665 [Actinomycetes bacterium KLBMP 9797]
MKYRAEIVITHVATVSDLVVLLRAENQVCLHATIQQSTVEPLTSPLDAISHLDKALLRALTRTALFEEFEVARRSLRVAPLGA